MLVIPTPGNGTHWTEEAQNLVPGLAHFIAQALINSRTPSPTVTTELEPEIAAPVTTVPAAIVLDKVRLKDLEDQLKQVREEFNEAEQKRRQAEANANAAQKQARYLAAALRSVQSPANNSASGETGRETSDSPEDNVESEANQSI
jgi:type IV secretory pathway VirB10-like protein